MARTHSNLCPPLPLTSFITSGGRSRPRIRRGSPGVPSRWQWQPSIKCWGRCYYPRHGGGGPSYDSRLSSETVFISGKHLRPSFSPSAKETQNRTNFPTRLLLGMSLIYNSHQKFKSKPSHLTYLNTHRICHPTFQSWSNPTFISYQTFFCTFRMSNSFRNV